MIAIGRDYQDSHFHPRTTLSIASREATAQHHPFNVCSEASRISLLFRTPSISICASRCQSFALSLQKVDGHALVCSASASKLRCCTVMPIHGRSAEPVSAFAIRSLSLPVWQSRCGEERVHTAQVDDAGICRVLRSERGLDLMAAAGVSDDVANDLPFPPTGLVSVIQ